MITSGSLSGVMVSQLTWNVRDVGSIPALGVIVLVFITSTVMLSRIEVDFGLFSRIREDLCWIRRIGVDLDWSVG